MRPGVGIIAGVAARFSTPLIALFAFALLFESAPGAGVGFIAGLAFGLLLVLHALVFGVVASRRALAPVLARTLLALGVIVAASGAGFPDLEFAPQLIEAGAFVTTTAAAALLAQVTFGRAPTLGDGIL